MPSAVGALTTAGVLVGGFVAFKRGNTNLSQQMMRARVIAQGATIAIMLGSSGGLVDSYNIGEENGQFNGYLHVRRHVNWGNTVCHLNFYSEYLL